MSQKQVVQKTPPPPTVAAEPSFQSSFTPPAPAKLREDLIEKAVGFLTHPKVQDSSLSRKKDFLREKKGLTEPEIDEALRRSGADAPKPSYDNSNNNNNNRTTMMMQQPMQQVAPPKQEGYSLVSMFAGGVALAATGIAAYYGWEQYRKSNKKSSKKKKMETPKKGKTPKKKFGKGEEEAVAMMTEVDENEEKEIKKMVEVALQVQNEDQLKVLQDIERLMHQIEDNNKQKFELLKANGPAVVEDAGMKNDIQTIKQLLLTRNSLLSTVAPPPVGGVISPEKKQDEKTQEKEKEKEEAEETASELTPSVGLSQSQGLTVSQSGSQGLKPWEQRRRVRIESAAAVTSSSAPSTPNTNVPVTPASTPITTTTATESQPNMTEEKN